MADNLKMLIKSLKIYARMDLLWLLRDTKYCALQIIADIISVTVIYDRDDIFINPI